MSVPGDCEKISPTISKVGNKWTVLTILILSEGPKRYNQMRREIESISQRMLTVTLRGLERDGLVSRRVIADRNPVAVEYSLTELGRTLIPTLFALCHWSASNTDLIEQNQRRFDGIEDDGDGGTSSSPQLETDA